MRRKSIRPKIGLPKREPWKKQPKGLPSWVKSIPQSHGHGSGHLQKRLWRLTSDTVRIRDKYKFGVCVATNAKISDWRAFQAGHWISYSVCNGLFKFNTKNIHAQTAMSNKLQSREMWQAYEAELIRRYGIQYLNDLEDENKRTPVKFTTQDILVQMEKLLHDMNKLPEQPEYFAKVYERLTQNTS